jgi:hypothetical protein
MRPLGGSTALRDLLAARGEGSASALVESRRQGREVLFSVRPEPLESAALWMAAVAAEWDARLAALKRLAEEG